MRRVALGWSLLALGLAGCGGGGSPDPGANPGQTAKLLGTLLATQASGALPALASGDQYGGLCQEKSKDVWTCDILDVPPGQTVTNGSQQLVVGVDVTYNPGPKDFTFGNIFVPNGDPSAAQQAFGGSLTLADFEKAQKTESGQSGG